MKTCKNQGEISPNEGPQPQIQPQTQPQIKHLYIRGNYRQDILFDKIDFTNAWNRIWLSALAKNVDILAVEILSNHIHIIVRTKLGGPQLFQFVHHLRMSLSYYFNRRYDVHGSLGSRRYGSATVTPIEADAGEDLRDLICYIHRNVKHHGIRDDYQNWPYSTFRALFGLSEDQETYTGEAIPKELLKAYTPASCPIPDTWSMTAQGLIVPPPEIYPREEIEKLFAGLAPYLQASNTPTRRESNDAPHEEKIGRKSQKISDQQIMDYIQEHSLIPIISMSRDQCTLAAKAVKRAFPKVSLRQLSRILHIPTTSLHYYLEQS